MKTPKKIPNTRPSTNRPNINIYNATVHIFIPPFYSSQFSGSFRFSSVIGAFTLLSSISNPSLFRSLFRCLRMICDSVVSSFVAKACKTLYVGVSNRSEMLHDFWFIFVLPFIALCLIVLRCNCIIMYCDVVKCNFCIVVCSKMFYKVPRAKKSRNFFKPCFVRVFLIKLLCS